MYIKVKSFSLQETFYLFLLTFVVFCYYMKRARFLHNNINIILLLIQPALLVSLAVTQFLLCLYFFADTKSEHSIERSTSISPFATD